MDVMLKIFLSLALSVAGLIALFKDGGQEGLLSQFYNMPGFQKSFNYILSKIVGCALLLGGIFGLYDAVTNWQLSV